MTLEAPMTTTPASPFVVLSREYVARDGSPRIDQVDLSIFTLTYFARCMECTFCHDACCAHGCDVDLQREEALLARAPERWRRGSASPAPSGSRAPARTIPTPPAAATWGPGW